MLMPSLTLIPGGADKSRISLHLPGLFRLGITPNRLMWMGGEGCIGFGTETIRPADISSARYESTGSGLRCAEVMLAWADCSCVAFRLKPIRKPCKIPEMMYLHRCLSGWRANSWRH